MPRWSESQPRFRVVPITDLYLPLLPSTFSPARFSSPFSVWSLSSITVRTVSLHTSPSGRWVLRLFCFSLSPAPVSWKLLASFRRISGKELLAFRSIKASARGEDHSTNQSNNSNLVFGIIWNWLSILAVFSFPLSTFFATGWSQRNEDLSF